MSVYGYLGFHLRAVSRLRESRDAHRQDLAEIRALIGVSLTAAWRRSELGCTPTSLA